MKKKFLMLISAVLALMCLMSACNNGGDVLETIATEQSESYALTDALIVNGVNISDYKIVYDTRANVGTKAIYNYFNAKLKQLYGMELESEASISDGYQITIGVKGTDASVLDFYASCGGGMIGFDGKRIYLLATDKAGLYSVVDAFFAKAVADGERSQISISENEKAAITTESLTVMSYNVLYDMYYDEGKQKPRNLELLANSIKEQCPDVFGTQETQDEHMEAILAAMPNYDCYKGLKLKGGANMSNMVFWNADRYKLVSKGFQYLTDTPLQESKIPESNSYRGFSYVVLESLATQKQFLFVDVHITYRNADGATNDDTVRVKQGQYLLKFLESKKYETMPIILVGDFNSNPDKPSIQNIENSKRLDRAALVAKTKGDLEGTTTVKEHTLRDGYKFDHIFVTSDRIVTEYFTTINNKIDNAYGSPRYPSDHLPVLAKVVIY